MKDHDFVNFDDLVYVVNNSQVKAGLSWAGIQWAFGTLEASNWHPLTWISLMSDVTVFGYGPRGHHLVNLMFHGLNAGLLYIVLSGLTGTVWRSALTAALFAVHPLHVESVAWVAERKDVLSALFWILSLWAYLRHVRRPGGTRYFLALSVFALGLLAKPMLVTFPLVLLLLDWWPLGRLKFPVPLASIRGMSPSPSMGEGGGSGHREPHRSFRGEGCRFPSPVLSPEGGGIQERGGGVFLEKVPFLLLSAASSVITYLAQQRGGSVSLAEMLPFKFKLYNTLVSYLNYLLKTAWPAGLAAVYPHPGPGIQPWKAALAGCALVTVTALLLAAAGRRPYALAGWVWYLVTLVPVIGLIQVGPQGMADRYTYIPLIGVFIILAWAAGEAGQGRRTLRLITASGAVAVLLGFMWAASRQVGYWRDGKTLFSRALEVTSGNVLAHNNLGQALMAGGDVRGAIEQFRKVLVFDNSNAGIHYNLAVALSRQGKSEEAMAHYLAALRSKPGTVEAHNNLGILYAQSGDLGKAADQYREALRYSPGHPAAHFNLGMVLEKQGRPGEAAAHYRAAVKGKPGDTDALNNLGYLLQRMGELEESLTCLREAVRLKPDSSTAQNNPGVTLAMLGRLEEAVPHFTEGVRLDPANSGARLNLERALAGKAGSIPR